MNERPAPGTRLRCITARDRPELIEGAEYVVVPEVALDKMPINYARWQPDDFRLIAVRKAGQHDKPTLIVALGVFEVIGT